MKSVKSIVILGILLSALSACTKVGFGNIPVAENKSASCGECIPTPSPTPGGPTIVNQAFQVPPLNGKADIVFVIDSSPAMFVTVQAMATRLGTILATLGTSIDYQVGIMNASMTAYDGYNFPLNQMLALDPFPVPTNGNLYLLNNNTDGADYILDENMDFDGATWPGGNFCLLQPYCAVGAPQPMKALVAMMNNRTVGGNAGFFRPGATLVPVIFTSSDENAGQSGATQPADVITAFNNTVGTTMQGMKAFTFEVQPGDTSCMNTYNSVAVGSLVGGYAMYGTAIDQFAKATGGSSNTLCQSDYSAALSKIPAALGPQVTSFSLSGTPLAGSLKVVAVPSTTISYTLQGQTLVFASALPANTKVSVSYLVSNP